MLIISFNSWKYTISTYFFSSSSTSTSSSSLPTTSGSSGSSGSGVSNPIQDLIKCFCGVCESFFKRSTIEYALRSNGDELLRNPEAREILKKYLIYQKGKSNFKQVADEIVMLYELADDILKGEKDLEENRADLDDLLFTEYWVMLKIIILHNYLLLFHFFRKIN